MSEKNTHIHIHSVAFQSQQYLYFIRYHIWLVSYLPWSTVHIFHYFFQKKKKQHFFFQQVTNINLGSCARHSNVMIKERNKPQRSRELLKCACHVNAIQLKSSIWHKSNSKNLAHYMMKWTWIYGLNFLQFPLWFAIIWCVVVCKWINIYSCVTNVEMPFKTFIFDNKVKITPLFFSLALTITKINPTNLIFQKVSKFKHLIELYPLLKCQQYTECEQNVVEIDFRKGTLRKITEDLH